MSHFQFPTLASNHACNLLPLSLNKYLYFDLFHQTKIKRKPTCGIKCKQICLLYYKFHNIPLINQHWVWRRAVCCQLPVACTWRDHSQLDWVERVAGQQLSVEPSIDHGGLWQRLFWIPSHPQWLFGSDKSPRTTGAQGVNISVRAFMRDIMLKRVPNMVEYSSKKSLSCCPGFFRKFLFCWQAKRAIF